MLEVELVDGVTGCAGVELDPPVTGQTGVEDGQDGVGEEFAGGVTGCAGVELEPPYTGQTGVEDDQDGVGEELVDGVTGWAGDEDGLGDWLGTELVSLSVTGQTVVVTAMVDVTTVVCV